MDFFITNMELLIPWDTVVFSSKEHRFESRMPEFKSCLCHLLDNFGKCAISRSLTVKWR